MDQKALFIKFWEKEAPAMRKVIERIPEGSEYRPEPKSRMARDIAWLIVHEEIALVEGLESGAIAWDEIPAPATIKEILSAYDGLHETAGVRLRAIDAATWEKDLAFMYQGNEAWRSSGYDMAWAFLFDVIHHRGQLSTYLRPMGSTVPQIYGPSADEPMG
jgi:uncharacterized damage-inducible protein DinB